MAVLSIVRTIQTTGGDFADLDEWEIATDNLLTTAVHFAYDNLVSGPFTDFEAYTATGGKSGTIYFDNGSNTMAIIEAVGNVVDGDTITGSSSGATCDVNGTPDTGGIIEIAEMDASGSPWAGNLTIGGATVDATRYRHLRVQSGLEHLGVWGDGVRVESGTLAFRVLTIGENFVHLSDFEIEQNKTSKTNTRGIEAGSTNGHRFESLIGRGNVTSASSARGFFELVSSSNDNIEVVNCIGFEWEFGNRSGNGALTRYYNCTFYNCGQVQMHRDMSFRNCIHVGGWGTTDFLWEGSTWNGDLDFNLSSDASADDNESDPGTSVINASATDTLTDPANQDFTLKAGSAAIDVGRTQTEATPDIADVARPIGASYDMGAFERAAAPAGGRIMSSLVREGGLAGVGGIAGAGGGLAG